jgi:hypothetical protein
MELLARNTESAEHGINVDLGPLLLHRRVCGREHGRIARERVAVHLARRRIAQNQTTLETVFFNVT